MHFQHLQWTGCRTSCLAVGSKSCAYFKVWDGKRLWNCIAMWSTAPIHGVFFQVRVAARRPLVAIGSVVSVSEAGCIHLTVKLVSISPAPGWKMQWMGKEIDTCLDLIQGIITIFRSLKSRISVNNEIPHTFSASSEESHAGAVPRDQRMLN